MRLLGRTFEQPALHNSQPLPHPRPLPSPLVTLAGLENDLYVRQIEGYLPTAEVAFIDEIFKVGWVLWWYHSQGAAGRSLVLCREG